MPAETYLIVVVAMMAVMTLSLVAIVAKCYRRCPTNRALVIYGRTAGNQPVCVYGGAVFIVPMLQSYGYLTLEPIRIDLHMRELLTKDLARITLSGAFTVGVSTSPPVMANAATRLLDQSADQIRGHAEEVISAQLGSLIAGALLGEITEGRASFLTRTRSSLEDELNKIGLTVISFHPTLESVASTRRLPATPSQADSTT